MLLTRQPDARYFAWTNEQWDSARIPGLERSPRLAELGSAGGLPPLNATGLVVNAYQTARVLETGKNIRVVLFAILM